MESRRRVEIALLTAVAALLLFWGWRTFWYLTDDAFIAFRYISNRDLGHGYVWNAAPFRAVEGYTSFLWVALLAAHIDAAPGQRESASANHQRPEDYH